MTTIPSREAAPAPSPDGGPTVLTPREVPLGGLRAMTVRRTLPQRVRSTIGPFCFVDHYGPDNVAMTGGMKVPPHPHTGLQTVTWLFSGEVEHRDSLGTRATVRPGQLNLMTAGRGISHSEDSTPTTTVLHGVQLWTVLPARFMGMEPQFEHFAPEPVELPGARVRVFLGALAGSSSPVRVFSPIVGAEVSMPPGGEVALDLAGSFEHGYLLDEGAIAVDGHRPQRGELLYVPPGQRTVHLRAGASGGRLLLIGGTPFTEEIVMWWNFIGRTHEDVVEARAQWQREIGAPDADGPSAGERFGIQPGYPGGAPLPAPELPRNTRLKPRVPPMPAP